LASIRCSWTRWWGSTTCWWWRWCSASAGLDAVGAAVAIQCPRAVVSPPMLLLLQVHHHLLLYSPLYSSSSSSSYWFGLDMLMCLLELRLGLSYALCCYAYCCSCFLAMDSSRTCSCFYLEYDLVAWSGVHMNTSF
jgi:hypothetical protein